MTENAKYILEIISESETHLSAEEIYLNMKQMGLSVVPATVYNNLNALYKAELINKVSLEGYPDRYDRIVRHDHLVCKKCGKLTDISLKDITENIREQIGSDFISYDLKVTHICKDCLNKVENESHQAKGY